MSDQYVVVTRYVAPSGRAIVHAYGPYPTRHSGLAARDALLAEVDGAVIEASVCKVLGDPAADS